MANLSFLDVARVASQCDPWVLTDAAVSVICREV